MILLFAPLYGLIHALRGAGVKAFAKFYAGIYFAILSEFFLPSIELKLNLLVYLMVYSGYYLGISLGWGKYFNVAFPNMAYVNETEVPIIDKVTTAIMGTPTTPGQFERWCFVAFFFRSWLFYPLFVMLAYFNMDALCIGFGVVLMPVIYWARRLTPVAQSIRYAEFTYGTLLGLLILLSLGGY